MNIEEIFPESLYPTLGYTNITTPIESINEGDIDNIVNEKLMKRIYFSFNRLYYNFANIKTLYNRQVVIRFNFTANLCVIFDRFNEGNKLHTNIDQYNNNNNTEINLYSYMF